MGQRAGHGGVRPRNHFEGVSKAALSRAPLLFRCLSQSVVTSGIVHTAACCRSEQHVRVCFFGKGLRQQCDDGAVTKFAARASLRSIADISLSFHTLRRADQREIREGVALSG